MRHLNDDQIQEYLDSNSVEDRASMKVHLASCDFCRTRMLQFQRLYEELDSGELEENLSPGFADSVMARVAAEDEVASSPARVWDFLPVALGAVIGLAALFYFLDFQKIAGALADVKIPDFFTPLFTQVKQVSGGLDFGLILIAVFLLALVSFADYLFVQKKMWFSPRIR